MKLPEYTLSPELADAMHRAFAPHCAQRLKQMPLASWLDRQSISREEFLPPTVALPLAATLDQVLMHDGGVEGTALLEALDAIAHGGGKPALLIRGLPQDGATMPLIREAFRQKLFADPKKRFSPHLKLIDQTSGDTDQGFSPDGQLYLHQDDADVGLLFGVTAGDNPRHTCLLDVDDYIGRIVEWTENVGYPQTREVVTKLLSMPVWPVDTSGLTHADRQYINELNAQRREKADRLGLTVCVGKTAYAPILFPNPHAHGNPDASRFEVLGAPFRLFRERVQEPNEEAVPEHLRAPLSLCSKAIQWIARSTMTEKTGPVLGEGDLLVFNNRQLFHAGGPYVHDDFLDVTPALPDRLTPRQVCSMDVKTSPDLSHLPRPGECIAQPIRIGTLGVTVAGHTPEAGR
jgi:hypothetical protein